MSTITIAANALVSSVTLMLLCYLGFWRYRTYQVDLFRENMFILRDQLFDEASEGLIDFNHPAYGMLRRTMNGLIRFGHQLSFWQVLAIIILVDKKDIVAEKKDEQAWQRFTAELDEPTKSKLEEYKRRSMLLVLRHVLFTFPEVIILLPIVILPILMLVAIVVIRGRTLSIYDLVLNKLGSKVRGFDSAALTYGS